MGMKNKSASTSATVLRLLFLILPTEGLHNGEGKLKDISCVPSETSLCKCTLSNGAGDIDLSRLQDNELLTTKGIPDQIGQDIVYFYNPCGFLQKGAATSPCSPAENATLCQEKSGQYYNIGQGQTITYRVMSDNPFEVLLTYSQGTPDLPEYPSREATVSVVCDPHTDVAIRHTETHEMTGHPIEYGRLLEIPLELHVVSFLAQSFKLKTRFGCPTTATSSHSVSGGSIFLIILFSVILLYVVCGMLFNRIARGAHGVELLPHYEFWLSLPSLLQHGVYFLFCCNTQKKGQYEVIG